MGVGTIRWCQRPQKRASLAHATAAIILRHQPAPASALPHLPARPAQPHNSKLPPSLYCTCAHFPAGSDRPPMTPAIRAIPHASSSSQEYLIHLTKQSSYENRMRPHALSSMSGPAGTKPLIPSPSKGAPGAQKAPNRPETRHKLPTARQTSTHVPHLRMLIRT